MKHLMRRWRWRVGTVLMVAGLLGMALAADAGDLRYGGHYPFRDYAPDDIPTVGTPQHVYQDRQGLLWIAGDRGLIHYDGARFREYTHQDGLLTQHIYRLYESEGGELYACTWRGLQWYNRPEDRWEGVPIRINEPIRDVIALDSLFIFAADDGVWFTRGHGRAQYPLPLDDQLFKWHWGVVHDLAWDEQTRTLWVGTGVTQGALIALKIDPLLRLWDWRDQEARRAFEARSRKDYKNANPYGPASYDAFRIHDPERRRELLRESIEYFPVPDGQDRRLVYAVALPGDGRVKVSTVSGVMSMDMERRGGLTLDPLTRLAGGTVHTYRMQNGREYISGSRGVWVIEGQDTLHLATDTGLGESEISALGHDRQRNLWLATVRGALIKLSHPSLERVPLSNLGMKKVVATLHDEERGRLLLAGPERILEVQDERIRTLHRIPNDSDPIRGMSLDHRGRLMVFTRTRILIERGGRLTALRSGLTPLEHEAQSALGYDGRLWIAMGDGVWSWDGRRLDPHLNMRPDFHWVNTMVALPDSSMAFGTWNGLYVLRQDGSMELFSPGDEKAPLPLFSDPGRYPDVRVQQIQGGITGFAVMTGVSDSRGSTWLGTYAGGIMRLAGDSVETAKTAFDEGRGRFTRFHRSGQDEVFHFFGGRQLARIGAGVVELLPEANPEQAIVNDVATDASGRTYLATSRGLIVVRDDTARAIIDKGSGLASSQVAELELLPDGSLMLEQADALVFLDVDRYLTRRPNGIRPLVTRLHVESEPHPVTRKVKLDHGQRRIQLSFALPDFTLEHANRYSWRLEGLDAGWTPWTERDEAYYEHLPPGSYRFHLRARNSLGEVNTAASPMEILVPAYFYETDLFVVVALLGLVALVFFFVQWRVKRVQRLNVELESRVQERTRELHTALDKLERTRATEMEAERLRTAQKLAIAVAHEFNSPLLVLLGVSNLMEKEEFRDTEKARDLLRRIPATVDRMSVLVQRLKRVTEIREKEYVDGITMLDLQKMGTQGGADDDDGVDEADSPREGV